MTLLSIQHPMVSLETSKSLSHHDKENLYWEHHLPSLYRYCLALTQNRADAEDLMQDTCLKLLSAQQKGIAKPQQQEAYRIRTARNTWIDTVRRRNYFQNYIQHIEPSVTNDDQHYSLDIQLAVQQLMVQLSPWQQAIFMLRDLFGYSAAETAQRLDTTEGAVKAALYRARTLLEKGSSTSIHEQVQSSQDEEDLTLLHQYVQALQTGDDHKVVQLTLMRMNRASQHVQAIATYSQSTSTDRSMPMSVLSNQVQSFLPYQQQSYSSSSQGMRMTA